MTAAPTGAVVLFTRDLRVHDHLGLDEAARRFERVAPLFVFDERLLRAHGTPNRLSFLLDALADLRESLRRRGADLVVRRGDPVAETLTLARATRCTTVYVSADASRYAQQRERRLADACRQEALDLRVVETTAVVPPGALRPADRDHYRVFTPYWRRWHGLAHSSPRPAPHRLRLAQNAACDSLPSLRDLTRLQPAPGLPRGGEQAGRRRLEHWLADGLERYAAERDVLVGEPTSRLSPYLHLGCVSAREVVSRVRGNAGAEPFVRQLCWRDFFQQLLAANPDAPHRDLRPRGTTWREDDEALARWREGRTGYPVVDATMRQLAHEGWISNRARLITGSFLTRTLRLDWRHGARVFFELLVDGDVASNVGNWQWVAGTGANPRPNRALDPIRQAARFDPHGEYVRRWVPELSALPTGVVHPPRQAARPRSAANHRTDAGKA